MSSTVMDRLFLELSNVVSPDAKTARELALENHIAELKAELRIWRGDLAKVEIELSSARKTAIAECVALVERERDKAFETKDSLARQEGAFDMADHLLVSLKELLSTRTEASA